jgi:gliding motility-associated-like protein
MRNILFILSLFFSLIGFSQNTKRLVPIIDSVTVINNRTQISWSFEDDPNYHLTGFKIYKAFGDSETDFAPFIDVDSLTFSLTDVLSTPDIKKERYKIAAYSATLDSLSPSSEFHQSIHLQINYDSCTRTNLISWNPYVNWENNVDYYQIYIKKEDANFEAWSITFQDTFFYHNSHDANTNYTYFVRAFSNDGQSSTSNLASVYTNIPIDPEFLNFYTASVADVNQLELRFSIDGNADVASYDLWRSDNQNSNYQSISSFSHNPDNPHIQFIDNVVTTRNIHYYFVTATNICDHNVWTTDTINSILLQLDTTSSYNNSLSWNKTSPQANENYKIFRSSDGINFSSIDDVNTTNYNDNILNNTDLAEGTICYYVEAISNEPNIAAINKSNIECLQKDPSINLPTVFSPNGDGKNDFFKPNISFITEENYQFVIVNRWGEKIFEATSINDSWDGTFNNSKVQQGTYIYYLKFSTSLGNIIEKSGNITVYYP